MTIHKVDAYKPCPVCSGDKKEDCDASGCLGRGKVPCHWCKGLTYYNAEPCTHCSNGDVTCSQCHGSGKIQCRRCHGTGHVPFLS